MAAMSGISRPLGVTSDDGCRWPTVRCGGESGARPLHERQVRLEPDGPGSAGGETGEVEAGSATDVEQH